MRPRGAVRQQHQTDCGVKQARADPRTEGGTGWTERSLELRPRDPLDHQPRPQRHRRGEHIHRQPELVGRVFEY